MYTIVELNRIFKHLIPKSQRQVQRIYLNELLQAIEEGRVNLRYQNIPGVKCAYNIHIISPARAYYTKFGTYIEEET